MTTHAYEQRNLLSMDAMLPTLQTERLQLRPAVASDAAFFVDLLNSPGWLEYIGDRQVNTLAQAERYIEQRVQRAYREHGFGMFVVCARTDGQRLGLCGLVQREQLDGPDLGFALLPAQVGFGYAGEAAASVLSHAVNALGQRRLYAIARADNARSLRLLGRLDFRYLRQWSEPSPVAVSLLRWEVDGATGG